MKKDAEVGDVIRFINSDYNIPILRGRLCVVEGVSPNKKKYHVRMIFQAHTYFPDSHTIRPSNIWEHSHGTYKADRFEEVE